MILLLDNYRVSLLIFKSLTKQNIPFIVGTHNTNSPIYSSKYCLETWTHPPFSEKENFLKALTQLLNERKEIDGIFPVGELGLIMLAENHERIPARINLMMPNKEDILLCLNKKKCSDMISNLKIPNAKGILIKSKNDLTEAINASEFPVIIKPNITVNKLQNLKAVIVRNSSDLYRLEEQWDETHPILLEKYINGDRISINLSVQDGKIITHVQNSIMQTGSLDKTGYTFRTVSMKNTEILSDYANRIVKEMHYNGIINIQFILCNKSKQYHFIEINPRMPATSPLLYKLGIDVTLYSLHIFGYRKLPGYNKKYVNETKGIICNWFWADFKAFLGQLNAGEYSFINAFSSFYRIIKYGIISDIDQKWYFDDFKPCLIDFYEGVYDIGSRNFKKIFKKFYYKQND